MADNNTPNLSEFDELAQGGGNGRRSGRKKSKVLPVLLGLILIFFLGAFFWFRAAMAPKDVTEVDQGAVAKEAGNINNTGIDTDSEVYRKAVREEDIERSDRASETGESTVPRLITDPLPEAPLVVETPPEEEPERKPRRMRKKEEPAPPPPIEYVPSTGGEGMLDAWLDKSNYTPGQLAVSNIEREKSEPSENRREIAEGENEPKLPELQVSPGDILYAVMEVGANSDQAGTPIVARVVSGEWSGAKFIGGFQRMDDRLVLQFNKAVIKDKRGRSVTYSVAGYAVDPNTYSPGVASSVDHHYLERWGGLIASSFLEGFGEAKSRSGTSYYYGNDNNPGQFKTDYDLSDEAWIAAGKVGEALSDKFSDNFNIPPTVKLEPGEAIGILLL